MLGVTVGEDARRGQHTSIGFGGRTVQAARTAQAAQAARATQVARAAQAAQTVRATQVAPPLPVDPALAPLLPGGLRRGSTVGVTGSISLLLALLGAASARGAWCALVGFPHISAEAAHEYGVHLSRLALVPAPGSDWTTAVGALLDAVDVVAVRPPVRIAPGEIRRLAARTRNRDAVFVAFDGGRGSEWPGVDVRLSAAPGTWAGIGAGDGRLRARRVEVTATGRGRAARPRTAELWLPRPHGGVDSTEQSPNEQSTGGQLAPVVDLAG